MTDTRQKERKDFRSICTTAMNTRTKAKPAANATRSSTRTTRATSQLETSLPAPAGGARAAATKSSRAVPKATRSKRQVTDHLLKADKKPSTVASSKVPIPRVATETVSADAEREPIKVLVAPKS